MSADKRELRRQIRQFPLFSKHQAICRRILEHPWFLTAETVMAYAALPDEPDLTAVLDEVIAAGKILVLPRCEPDGTLTPRLVKNLAGLRSGTMQISEPAETEPLAVLTENDLILVPGRGFDPQGGRLGRGKGYYDRFLPLVPAKRLGVCPYLFPEIPMEAHDCRMDGIVTAENSFFCKRRNE